MRSDAIIHFPDAGENAVERGRRLIDRSRIDFIAVENRKIVSLIRGHFDEIPVDLVIVSVGVSPNPLIPSSIDGLDVTSKGTLAVNDKLQTSIPVIFAGGDIVRGGATVILAMGDGRKAAASMADKLLADA